MAPTQKENELWGFPATGLNVSSFVNSCREQQTERLNRRKLRKGIPSGVSVCRMHHELLIKQSQAVRDGIPADPELSLFNDPVFNPGFSTIPTTTALLPHCTICFYSDHHPPSGSPFPEAFDSCLCATTILTSNCAYCALATVEHKLSSAIADRIRLDIEGNDFLTCECGSHVMLTGDIGELVRKCIGCGGTVTAPFKNWAAAEVVFLKKSIVPALILPVGKVPDLESLVGAEPKLMPPPNLVINDPDLHLRNVRPPEKTATITPQVIERTKILPPTKSNGVPVCDNDIRRDIIDPSTKSRQPQRRHETVDGVTKRPPLGDITNQTIPSRRTRLQNLGQRAGKMPLATISRVMKSFGFSDGETEKILAFVMGHGLQEIEGGDLVAGIEKVLGRVIK